ncbi:hypothetical protein PPERSA_04081 [Pseudocohnilembus persalinus]|uniref:Uncharacterized protein n=1 Tax=Pseudocohnilembus persalinus TaxID=266149 RepID=A0A0V0QKX4_PSEPJ|nr:hypothetical protein PPERSA_04081 [Pseudocohnilembus persalinus]|eukprot:KRX02878.1 hypothetical protein PPERSA_04081 [Pseudocohnilembus persalinus]
MDNTQQYFSDYEDSNQNRNFSIKEDILNKNNSKATQIQSTENKELKQFPPLSNSPILNFSTLKISSSFHELKPLQLTNEPQKNINSDESQLQNVQLQNRSRNSSYSIFKPKQNCDNQRENLTRLNFQIDEKNQNQEIQNKSKKIYRKNKYQRPIINSLSPIQKSYHDQNYTENQILQSINLNQSNDNEVQISTNNNNNSDQIDISQSKPNFYDKFGNISGIFSNQYEQTTGIPKLQKYKKKQEQQSQIYDDDDDNNNDLLIKEFLKNTNNDKDDENQLSDDAQIQNDSQPTENYQNKLSFPKFNQNTPKFNIKNQRNDSKNISNDDLSFKNMVHNKGFQRLKKKNMKFKSQINHNLSNTINNSNINDNSQNNFNQNIQDKNGFENKDIKNDEQIIADSLQSASIDTENKNQKLLYQSENKKQKIQKTFKRILNNKNPNKTQIFYEKKNPKFKIGDDNNIQIQNNESSKEDQDISNQNQKQQNQTTDSTSNQNEQNIRNKKNHEMTEKSQILSENQLEFAKEEDEDIYKNEQQ